MTQLALYQLRLPIDLMEYFQAWAKNSGKSLDEIVTLVLRDRARESFDVDSAITGNSGSA